VALTERLALLIEAQADQAVKNFKGLGKESTDLEAQAGHTGKVLGTALTAGALVGAVAIGKMVVSGISALKEQEAAAAQTRAVLDSTGGVARVTAGDVEELAKSVSDYSGQTREAIASTENVLLTFTNVRNEAGKGNDIFDQATKSIVDLSQAMHIDLQSAAVLVGKALNSPADGLTRLIRIGVTFTDQQKEQIKALDASGHSLQAQQVIIGELNREFGGSAKAFGDSAEGAAAKLKNSFTEAEKELAKPLLAPLTTALKDVTGFIDYLNAHPLLEHSAEAIAGAAIAATLLSKGIGLVKSIAESNLVTTVRSAAAHRADAAAMTEEAAAARAAAGATAGLAEAETTASATVGSRLAGMAGAATKLGLVAGTLYGTFELFNSINPLPTVSGMFEKLGNQIINTEGIDGATKKLDELRAEYAKVADAQGSNSKTAKEYQTEIAGISAAIDKVKAADQLARGSTDALSAAQQAAADKAQAAADAQDALAKAVKAAQDAASSSFGSAEDIVAFKLTATAADVKKAQDALDAAQKHQQDAQRAQDQLTARSASSAKTTIAQQQELAKAAQKVADSAGVRLAAAQQAQEAVQAKVAASHKTTVAQQQAETNAAQKVADATDAVTAAKKNLDDVTAQAANPGQQYASFLQDQLTQANTFVDGVAKASAKGIGASTIADLLKAGPEKAAPVLEALAADHSGKLVALVNSTQKTLDALNARTVEDARLTQLAIQSSTDTLTKDLSTAISISGIEAASGGSAAGNAQAIAKALGISQDDAQRIADEFGISLSKALGEQNISASAAEQEARPGLGAGNGVFGPVVRRSSTIGNGVFGPTTGPASPTSVTNQTNINIDTVQMQDVQGLLAEADRRKRVANLVGGRAR